MVTALYSSSLQIRGRTQQRPHSASSQAGLAASHYAKQDETRRNFLIHHAWMVLCRIFSVYVDFVLCLLHLHGPLLEQTYIFMHSVFTILKADTATLVMPSVTVINCRLSYTRLVWTLASVREAGLNIEYGEGSCFASGTCLAIAIVGEVII